MSFFATLETNIPALLALVMFPGILFGALWAFSLIQPNHRLQQNMGYMYLFTIMASTSFIVATLLIAFLTWPRSDWFPSLAIVMLDLYYLAVAYIFHVVYMSYKKVMYGPVVRDPAFLSEGY